MGKTKLRRGSSTLNNPRGSRDAVNEFDKENRQQQQPKSTEEVVAGISSEMIRHIIEQVHRSFERNRKVRVKLLVQLNSYFSEIAKGIEDEPGILSKVVESFNDIMELIRATTSLCILLSEPATKIPDIFETVYDLGAFIEAIILAIIEWCRSNDSTSYVEMVESHLTSLLNLSCENLNSWLYYELISPLVLHSLQEFYDPKYFNFRERWAVKSVEIMKKLGRAIYNCGDFGCQYYLTSTIHSWVQWLNGGKAIHVINSMFSYVPPMERKELLGPGDTDTRVQTFLNAFNESARGPKSVITMRCLYALIGDDKLNVGDFWVNFSIISGRLWAIYSDTNDSLVTLGIRRDQIQSICLNWVVNIGSQELNTQETLQSPSSFQKDERILFFHVVLNMPFGTITNNVEVGGESHSLYFVFREGGSIEKVMSEMGYTQHQCGSLNCEHPRTLRKLLKNQNKLTYTETWCSDCRISGLDRTPDRTIERTFQGSTPRTQRRSPFRRHPIPAAGVSFSFDQCSVDSSETNFNIDKSLTQSLPNTPENLVNLVIQDLPSNSPKPNPATSETPHSYDLCVNSTSPNDLAVNTTKPNMISSETSSAFYVSQDMTGTVIKSSVSSLSQGKNKDVIKKFTPEDKEFLNASALTFLEEPIPRKIRKKFGDVPRHSPFYKSKKSHVSDQPKLRVIDEIEEMQNHCSSISLNKPAVVLPSLKRPSQKIISSPKTDAPFQVRSPLFSEIGSPPQIATKLALIVTSSDSDDSFRSDENGSFLSPVIGFSKRLQENSVVTITSTPPAMSPKLGSPAPSAPHSAERMSTPPPFPSHEDGSYLSPVVGFSKPLQENSVVTITSTPTAMSSKLGSPAPSAPHSAERMSTPSPFSSHEDGSYLSPVVGFSKRLQLQEKSASENKRSEAKTTCYSDAFQKFRRRLFEKSQNKDYDPYDIWSCSELEEFKDNLFPERKLKTYGREKSSRSVRGRKSTVKPPKRLQQQPGFSTSSKNQMQENIPARNKKSSNAQGRSLKRVIPLPIRKTSFPKTRN